MKKLLPKPARLYHGEITRINNQIRPSAYAAGGYSEVAGVAQTPEATRVSGLALDPEPETVQASRRKRKIQNRALLLLRHAAASDDSAVPPSMASTNSSALKSRRSSARSPMPM